MDDDHAKASRDKYQKKRDNRTDAVGYLGCVEKCTAADKVRAEDRGGLKPKPFDLEVGDKVIGCDGEIGTIAEVEPECPTGLPYKVY